MKQKAYEKLIQNLDEIVKQYRLLLDSVRKEKELLIKSDITQLNENNERKEQFIAKIKNLDDNRLMFASDLAQAIGADHLEPRLLQLAQKMGGAEGDRLRTMHSTLELLITRLMTLNKENAVYAESALKTVNSALENIKDAITGGQKTYQKKGQYQQGYDKSGHLISKEA
jgi:FlgN protein